MCQGLDEAVQSMKLQEVAEVTVQPEYGYSTEQHEGQQAAVPPNSTLHYTVELLELQKVRAPCRTLCSGLPFCILLGFQLQMSAQMLADKACLQSSIIISKQERS